MMSAQLQQLGEVSNQRDQTTSTPQDSVLRNRAGDGDSNSPYVKSHAESPVRWQLLDDAALAYAKRHSKLIFMHIGFKACHYCRLTTLESFSEDGLADLLNDRFVPILIDREERPDIDAIYMTYIQAVNGAGGWPINVFLTPDLEPVFGGTYWTGTGRHEDMRANDGEFGYFCRQISNVWYEQEARCRKEARDIVLQLREFAAEGTLGSGKISTSSLTSNLFAPAAPSTLIEPVAAVSADLDVDLDQLEEAYSSISKSFDRENGGFNVAPKFPTPFKTAFLLRLAWFPQAVADIIGEPPEVEHATHMALKTLRAMRDGGLRDHVGAGFFRYSETADWSVPHFEKMVVDNALLLGVFLDAWLGQAAAAHREPALDDEFADVVLELGEHLGNPTSRLVTDAQMFATSEASDSFYKKGDKHMRQGAYYLWTRREFDATVSSGATVTGNSASANDDDLHARVAAARWNILEHGNIPHDQDPHDEFINQNVLRVVKSTSELSVSFGMTETHVRSILADARQKLFERRQKERVPPELDDKVVTAYNGMVIGALARAGAALRDTKLDVQRGQRWLNSAKTAANNLKNLWDPETKTMRRTWWRGEKGGTEALAEDYAFLIEGLLEVYDATGDESYLRWAGELQDTQIELFYDPIASTRPSSRPTTRSSSGGFYSTAESAPHTILRLKDCMDTSQPSTNSVSAANLFRLALILDELEGGNQERRHNYEKLARETVKAFEVEMLQYPQLFTGLLGSVVTARLGGERDVVEWSGEVNEKAQKVRKGYFTKPRGALRALVYKKRAENGPVVNDTVPDVVRQEAVSEMVRKNDAIAPAVAVNVEGLVGQEKIGESRVEETVPDAANNQVVAAEHVRKEEMTVSGVPEKENGVGSVRCG